jgi:competence protein ComEC
MSKEKKILLIPVIFLILLLGCVLYFQFNQHKPDQFKVSFFDIGQGDATLIQFNNGQKMLVDCGKDKRIMARLGETLLFYDRTIDYLLVTHPDLDHYGGCVDVLKNYTIKEIITNGHTKPDSFWATFDNAMRDEGAVLKKMAQPEVWTIGSSTLEFLSPDKTLVMNLDADDSNNYSIVFRLKNNSENFLFTADMEVPLENALLSKYCILTSTEPCAVLQSNILKVGHHGSDSSSGEDFLRAVGAKVGIISVGVENKYGHPSRRVMKKLERAGMEILRTDQMGSIIEY